MKWRLILCLHIFLLYYYYIQHMGEEEFSFAGDVESERGGTSLKFESRLDDHTIVDLQFTRRLILRTIELLFHERKWERLVDIGLKFISLTKSVGVEHKARYTYLHSV